MFSNFELQRTEKAKITEYPGFVLIENGWPEPWAMPTDRFAKHMDKHNNESWIFDPFKIPTEDRFFGVADSWLKFYKKNPDSQLPYMENEHVSTLELAEKNKFSNIVYDGSVEDGYVYNLAGDPIYRYFFIEEGDYQFNVQAAFKEVKGKPGVKNLEIRIAPHWSSYDETLSFMYQPSSYEEFLTIHNLDLKEGSFGARQYIFNLLGAKYYEE